MVAISLSLPLDYVVHLGAGAVSAASEYVRLGLKSVVLGSVDPQDMPNLRKQATHLKSIQVASGPISPSAAAAVLHRYNHRALNGFLEPAEALFELFPGLQKQGEFPVDTLAVAQWVQESTSAIKGKGLLVIEVPGQGRDILYALSEAGCLERFQLVRMQEGRKQLYKGGSTSAQLCSELETLGYEVWEEAAAEDPARPYLIGWRNTPERSRAKEVKANRQALDLCEADLAELQKRYGALMQEKEGLEELLERLVKHLETAESAMQIRAPETEN